jgi:transposase-like protein
MRVMSNELNNETFQYETKAREWLEAQLWPNGPVCPHCGVLEESTPIATRAGWYQCNSCRKQFSVTVGTLFERSHIPLNKWLTAAFLICVSKKGMSTHQLHRMIGVSYKSTWFMMHRIREAMREGKLGPLGGEGKFVEADETFTGGKAKNRAYKAPPPKESVFALVERGGQVRSYHVPEVTAVTLKPIIVDAIPKDSHFRTDESGVYWSVGEQFASHHTVIHSIGEYVRGDAHTNTIEGYFSILKRGIYGTYHHVSQTHLKRYLGEFDFRYNYRTALGFTDRERATIALKGIVGKRLTYRRTPNQGEEAGAA